MRVLITGTNGMLGQELCPVLAPRHDVLALSHSACDITDEDAVHRVMAKWQPQLIVNCAAYADVDGCERDPERAWAVNAFGPGVLARTAAEVSARLFHISTDYVFDGRQHIPYVESDSTHPINYYGQTKLEGEQQVLAANREGARHLIIRTSWLYGQHRRSFVDRTLADAKDKGHVEAVAEQVSCPTWAFHLAERIAELAETQASGILHLVGSGFCSRYEMACYIAAKVGPFVTVAPISWEKFRRPARRPLFTAMTSERLAEFGIHQLPHWTAALDEFLRLRLRASVPTAT